MSREIKYVTPAEMFPNWGELSEEEKKALEEAQYRKQLYSKTYGD